MGSQGRGKRWDGKYDYMKHDTRPYLQVHSIVLAKKKKDMEKQPASIKYWKTASIKYGCTNFDSYN